MRRKYREHSVRRAAEAILRRVDLADATRHDFPVPARLERSLHRATWARYDRRGMYLRSEPSELWEAAWALVFYGTSWHTIMAEVLAGKEGRCHMSRPYLERLARAVRKGASS